MFCVKDGVIRITRGDTGTITIHLRKGSEFDPAHDRVVFEVMREETRERLIHEVLTPTADGTVTLDLSHETTRDFAPGNYFWDVRIALGAQLDAQGRITGASEVLTPFEARRLEVRRAVGEL